MKAWADLERRVRNNENMMVKDGKGRYPKCLSEKQYEFCPKEAPKDPINVPQDCKQCPEFKESMFFSKVYMTHEKRMEIWKKRGLPLQY